MKSARSIFPQTVFALIAIFCTSASAGESAFLRIAQDEHGEPIALQASIVTYRPASSRDEMISVDLVSALHIADLSYYAELNRRFASYDSVLYELIAPAGTVIPAGGPERRSLLASTQVAVKNMLGLAFQLDEIDYSRANFVHADLSPEQFTASMEARNETFYEYFWKVFFFATKEYAKDPLATRDLDLLAALFATDQQRALKIEFAKELLNMDAVTDSLDGPDGSTLISERNKQAIKILGERMDAGDRRIAIFYGAGHLADLEQRLIDNFGLELAQVTWIDAWDLAD